MDFLDFRVFQATSVVIITGRGCKVTLIVILNLSSWVVTKPIVALVHISGVVIGIDGVIITAIISVRLVVKKMVFPRILNGSLL